MAKVTLPTGVTRKFKDISVGSWFVCCDKLYLKTNCTDNYNSFDVKDGYFDTFGKDAIITPIKSDNIEINVVRME